MLWFSIATISPVLFLAMAGTVGGLWCAVALIYLTGFTYFMDRIVHGTVARRAASGEFPVGEELAIFLGLSHLVLLCIALYALAGPSGLSWTERVACFFAFGLFFGQVSNANAHELIHKQAKWPRRLGKAVYISLLFGHHASAHPKVHHVWVATPMDPNSPAKGQNFYQFWMRAWVGSFCKGWMAETRLRARKTTPPHFWSHPYVTYIAGGLCVAYLTHAVMGLGGLVALVLLTGYAQMQLLISDYVQHYGLARERGADGRFGPVSAQHSWNAPQFFSSALMLNAPRHSDHHMHPLKTYPSLDLDPTEMPTLPRSLPVMGLLALWPQKWRAVMDPKLAALRQSHTIP
ncbi:alkane 1-monooxygenase [Shimia litoralis]|uniref:Alkane 1-monooxygenase n=1 Tax=Shimia litoralis TaxID=420403 RepID=A0A4U7N6W7_9RHOB|nr:alkane 1-monooxygenase [Shimia litoralis]TKZ21610.1 alkane 1-monooxygenase [Shimia litoralis]